MKGPQYDSDDYFLTVIMVWGGPNTSIYILYIKYILYIYILYIHAYICCFSLENANFIGNHSCDCVWVTSVKYHECGIHMSICFPRSNISKTPTTNYDKHMHGHGSISLTRYHTQTIRTGRSKYIYLHLLVDFFYDKLVGTCTSPMDAIGYRI